MERSTRWKAMWTWCMRVKASCLAVYSVMTYTSSILSLNPACQTQVALIMSSSFSATQDSENFPRWDYYYYYYCCFFYFFIFFWRYKILCVNMWLLLLLLLISTPSLGVYYFLSLTLFVCCSIHLSRGSFKSILQLWWSYAKLSATTLCAFWPMVDILSM